MSFIGAANWQQTMNLISKVWIQDAIRPKGAQKCGHHVAGRKFSACDSSSQVLFYPFLPPNPSGMLSKRAFAGVSVAAYMKMTKCQSMISL